MTPGEVFASFSSTIASVKALGDLVKTVAGLEQSATVNAAIIEIQQKVLEHQAAHAEILNRCNELVGEKETLRAEVRALQKKLAEATESRADFDRYALVALTDGLAVHALKQSAAEGEPPHWLCPNCLANGSKGILHVGPARLKTDEPELTVMRCPVCGSCQSAVGHFRPCYA